VTVVLDASVLPKWFLHEEGSEAVLRVKQQYVDDSLTVAIPDLALYEVANVLRFKQRVPEPQVQTAIRALWTMELDTLSPTTTLLEHGVHLSYQTGLSVYDCIYLALAKELNAVLVTADERLCRAGAAAVRVSLLR